MESTIGKVTALVLCLALFCGCASQNVAQTDNGTNIEVDNSAEVIADGHVDMSTRTLPLNTTDGTEANGVVADVREFQDRQGIHIAVSPDHRSSEQEDGCDNCTFLVVDKTPFKDGVIEIKVAGQPSEGAPAWARGFVGVVFRVSEDNSEYEGFYLRPVNALEEGPRRYNTFQYFSYPDYPWHLLRDEFPGKYEGYADVEPGRWIDLRIEVKGASATFFVNDEQVLVVDELFHGADFAGGIGLFTEPATDAYFSDLTIIPDHWEAE